MHNRVVMAFVVATTVAGCAFVPRSFFSSDPYNEPLPANYESVYRHELSGSAIASFAVPWYLRFSDGTFTSSRCPPGQSCLAEQAARCRWGLIAEARGDASAADDLEACQDFPTDENLVTLSLSSGGMRAAIFARGVMLALDELGLLKHVDVVSGDSGGAITAALYGLSCDRGVNCEASTDDGVEPLEWGGPEIDHRLQQDVLMRSFVSVLMPWNLVPYTFTDYSRTDLFANAMAAELYSRGLKLPFDTLPREGRTFGELNAARPNMLIGATVMTEPAPPEADQQQRLRTGTGSCFHFTLEDFESLGADLDSYPIADAVAASNAFPGVFYPIVLEQFHPDPETGGRSFLHLQDGGIRDQPAVSPVTEILFNVFPQAGNALAYRVPLDFCDISRAGRRSAVLTQESSLPSWSVDVLDGRVFASTFPDAVPPSIVKPGSARLMPKRIVNIFIDASSPTQGLSRTSPTANYDFADSIFGHRKIIEPVNVIIDEQRSIRATEYVELRQEIMDLESPNDALAGPAAESQGIDPDLCCHGIVFSIHDFYVGHRVAMSDEACSSPRFEEEWAALRGTGDRGLYAFSVEDFSGCGAADENGRRLYKDLIAIGLDFSINDRQFAEITGAARELVARMARTLCVPASGESGGGRYLFGNPTMPCAPVPWASPAPQLSLK